MRSNDAKIALIIGGGEGNIIEARAAFELIGDRPHDIFAINDVITICPYSIAYAVSLHPDKLEKWLIARDALGYPAPGSIWCHRPHNAAWRRTVDWGGSSGLFAVKIAMEEGYTKRILAGVPMTETRHFLRKTVWPYAETFRPNWRAHFKTIAEGTRSMSGWTAEMLGRPDQKWLGSP